MTAHSDQDQDDFLPSVEDMRDTLLFMWDWFFGQMIDSWLHNPGAALETEWGGAAVTMRYRTLTLEGGAYADFVELTIRANEGAFQTKGTFAANRDEPENAPPVAWSVEGDYEEFVAWMVPWVGKHVAEGGGWIDLP